MTFLDCCLRMRRSVLVSMCAEGEVNSVVKVIFAVGHDARRRVRSDEKVHEGPDSHSSQERGVDPSRVSSSFTSW